MIWPKALLRTRFDCFDKRDRLLLKNIIKDSVRNLFTGKKLRQLNRWRLYPLLAPFVDSDSSSNKVYRLTLQNFLLQFFNVQGHSSEQEHRAAVKLWLEQVLTCQEVKQQQNTPTRLTQTSWNVEGAKQLCINKLSSRHREADKCMEKGPLLLQELRASKEEIQAWAHTFPNCKLIGTEARSKDSQPAVKGQLGSTQDMAGFPALSHEHSRTDTEHHSNHNELTEEGGESTGQGGVGIAWNTLKWGIEASHQVLVTHFVVQVTFQKVDGIVTYVSAYLRPGEQLAILHEWTRAWRRKPPSGWSRPTSGLWSRSRWSTATTVCGLAT